MFLVKRILFGMIFAGITIGIMWADIPINEVGLSARYDEYAEIDKKSKKIILPLSNHWHRDMKTEYRIIDIETGVLQKTINHSVGHKNVYTSDLELAASISNSEDRLKIINLDTGHEIFTIDGNYRCPFDEISLSNDNKFLAYSTKSAYRDNCDQTIKILDIKQGSTVKEIVIDREKIGYITEILFAPNNRYLACIISKDDEEKVMFWDLKDSTLSFTAFYSRVRSIAFNPFGTVLVLGTENAVITVNPTTLNSKKFLSNTYYPANPLFSSDGNMFVHKLGSKNKVVIYDRSSAFLKIIETGSNKPFSKYRTYQIFFNDNNTKLFSLHNLSYRDDWKPSIKIWDIAKYNSRFSKYVYGKIPDRKLISYYQFIKKFPSKFSTVKKAKEKCSNLILTEKNLKTLKYIAGEKGELAMFAKEKAREIEKKRKEKIYAKILGMDSVEGYLWYMQEYQNSDKYNVLAKAIYEKIDKNKTITAYEWYINTFKRLSLQSTSEIEKAYQSIKNIIYAKAKEIDSVSTYMEFIKRYPVGEKSKNALTRIYEILFERAEKVNTIEAYNKFIFACPLSKQAKKAKTLAYELEKKQYTDIGMFGFIGQDSKMNKQARKLLISAKSIMDRGTEKNEFLTLSNLGNHMIVGRIYELVRNEFGDTDIALSLQESKNIDAFVEKIEKFRSSFMHNDNNIETVVSKQNNILSLLGNEIADIKNDSILEDFYKNNGKEEFLKYLERDRETNREIINTIKKNILTVYKREAKNMYEEIDTFDKLYEECLSSYSPVVSNLEPIELTTKHVNNKNVEHTMQKNDSSKHIVKKEIQENKVIKVYTLMLDKWNSALNDHDISTLSLLYAENLTYYGKKRTKIYCLNDKEKALAKYPKFTQNISNIDHEKISDSIYKITFTKQSRLEASAKERTFSGYLLVDIKKNKIIEEGDKTTDRKIGRVSSSIKKTDVSSSINEHFSNQYLKAKIVSNTKGNYVYFQVDVTNIYGSGKGGISISFPGLNASDSILGKGKYGFRSLSNYNPHQLVWNREYRKKVDAQYKLLEGWSEQWRKGEVKAIGFKLPKAVAAKTKINIRAVLITGRQEHILPEYGEKDQQGYPVKSYQYDQKRIKDRSVMRNTVASTDVVVKTKIVPPAKTEYSLSRFTRDNTNSIVLDNKTGNMWQDDEAVITSTKDWNSAITYCKTLSLGGYTDWILPDFKDFLAMATVDDAGDHNIPEIFHSTKKNSLYWSSSAESEDLRLAWSVFYYQGYDYWRRKTESYLVRCVRKIKTKEKKRLSQNNSSKSQNKYPYVCYNHKKDSIYLGCIRSSFSCQHNNKEHFGKYLNDWDAHQAFMRCNVSDPKFNNDPIFSKKHSNKAQNTYRFVCYDNKRSQGSRTSYVGCVRSRASCKNINKMHFGAYTNDLDAHAAFKRCYASNPRFVN